MIQRRQTLYLLIVTALSALMLALPLGRFLNADSEYVLTAFGVNVAGHPEMDGFINTWYMGVLIVMATVLPFVTIFLFKKRMLQMRLCFMEIVFLLGVQIFVGYYFYHMSQSVEGPTSFAIGDIFPLIGMIFTWLAIRGITKDEMLIRSMNRIR